MFKINYALIILSLFHWASLAMKIEPRISIDTNTGAYGNLPVALSPNGTMAVVFGDASVKIFNITGELIHTIDPSPSDNPLAAVLGLYSNPISSIAYSHDGRSLALGRGKKIEVWDTHTWQRKSRFTVERSDWFDSITFSHDGNKLAVFYTYMSGSNIIVSDIKNRRQLSGLKFGKKVWNNSISFSLDDSELIAIYSKEHTAQKQSIHIKRWAIDNGRLRRLLGNIKDFPYYDPYALKLDMNMALCCAEQTHLHYLNDENYIKTLDSSDIAYATFSPDGKWILISFNDGSAFVASTKSGKAFYTLTKANTGVKIVKAIFSENGNTLVSVSDHNIVNVWACVPSPIGLIKDQEISGRSLKKLR